MNAAFLAQATSVAGEEGCGLLYVSTNRAYYIFLQVLVGVYKNQGMWRARLFERNTDVYLGHWVEREEVGLSFQLCDQ